MKRYIPGLLASGAMMFAGAAAAQTAGGAGDWTGGYVGLNGGWNSAQTRGQGASYTVNPLSGVSAGAGPVSVPSTTFAATGGRHRQSGGTGGVTVGFNAAAGPVIWGVEGDFDGFANGNRRTDVYTLPGTALTTGSTVTVSRATDPRWEATLRGRVGMAMGPALVYATGGAAWVNLRQTGSYTYAPTVTGAVASANPGATFGPYTTDAGRSSDTRLGWTAGAGVELATSHNMSWGLEYRHTEAHGFSSDIANTAMGGVSEASRAKFRDDAVLAKVNFRFGGLRNLF